MAKRYIGDAVITIEYVGETPDGRGNYKGTVRAGKHTWRFDELHSGVGGVSSGKGYGYAADSPEADDEMALARFIARPMVRNEPATVPVFRYF